MRAWARLEFSDERSSEGENIMDKVERPEVLAVDIPVAGAMCGLSPARSYMAVKNGTMPVIFISKDRMKVPLAKWRRILNGETE